MWDWHPRKSIGKYYWEGQHLLKIWLDGHVWVVSCLELWKNNVTCMWKVRTFWGTSYLNCFRANIGEKVSNWRFNNLFHDAWCLLGLCIIYTYFAFIIYINYGVWVSMELDFLGPLNLIICHNWYVLVMIEHFSKWIELSPFWDKSNEKVVYAFLDQVLNRFGVSTKAFMI